MMIAMMIKHQKRWCNHFAEYFQRTTFPRMPHPSPSTSEKGPYVERDGTESFSLSGIRHGTTYFPKTRCPVHQQEEVKCLSMLARPFGHVHFGIFLALIHNIENKNSYPTREPITSSAPSSIVARDYAIFVDIGHSAE